MDTEDVNDTFATSWLPMEDATMLCISAVTQGTGEQNRLGRKYWIHSLHVRGRITEPAAESDTAPINDTIVRMCMVLDTQTNSAQLSASDVMNVNGTVDYLSFRNLQHTSRFKVLWDRTFRLNVAESSSNEGAANLFANGIVHKIFNIRKTFKSPIAVECELTTNVIAAITSNSIHMIGIATNATSTVNYQVRMRFRG